jgi:hypothetical protein
VVWLVHWLLLLVCAHINRVAVGLRVFDGSQWVTMVFVKGGFFSDPWTMSSAFDTSFWHSYPYLLPCLVSVGISALGVILGIFLLPETEAWLATRDQRIRQRVDPVSPSSASFGGYQSAPDDDHTAKEVPAAIDVDTLGNKKLPSSQSADNSGGIHTPLVRLRDANAACCGCRCCWRCLRRFQLLLPPSIQDKYVTDSIGRLLSTNQLTHNLHCY